MTSCGNFATLALRGLSESNQLRKKLNVYHYIGLTVPNLMDAVGVLNVNPRK